jgi:hypothetical protein
MKLLKQKINKLYYGKWPFKIECILPRSSMIVRLGVEDTRKWAGGADYGWITASYEERKGVLEFLNAIEAYLSKDIQIRTEGSHFNIFCKDRSLNNAIIKAVDKWIKATHGPDSDKELEFMLASGQKKVVCNKFPHDKFRYKINFKTNMNIDARPKFLEWAEKYTEKIYIADSTKRWLKGKTSYVQAPFMYVEDDKTLAMFGLFLGNNVRIVEEFILRSSINTSLDQE